MIKDLILKAPVASEADTQKAILDYLKYSGVFCWRNNSGGRKWEDKEGRERWFAFGKVGSGDILGLTRAGLFFSIEVKAKGKKPTPDQIEFMERVRANNGIAIVAYSVDDVISAGL